MSKDRLFSEAEVADIVRRAAELQDAGSTAGYIPGISSEELARVATEVGIEPKYLEAAIAERNKPNTDKKKFKWVEEVEKVLPVDLDPENFDVITEAVKIAPVMHSKGGVSGGVTQVGRSLQGQVAAGWDQPHFKVTSRGGRTKLSVRSSNSIATAMGILWIVPLMLTPVIGAVGHNWLAGAAAALACVFGGYFTARGVATKGHQATRDTADKLEKAINAAGPSLRENLAATKAPKEVTEEQEIQSS